jgi:hypothetical protein
VRAELWNAREENKAGRPSHEIEAIRAGERTNSVKWKDKGLLL